VLYLAEVQRKTRVLGTSKAEFKLLACQRSEQSWSAVPGEELVPAPDDVSYNAGALVMVDLSSNRQVQRHTEASRQLVSILQNFSRLQEKAKTQEEEIEQWKQSLTYQSQELNRREMEMEARNEQLQEMEADFERLEQQRQEIEATRNEVEQLKAEFERKSQELEGAWAHLQGEMNRFEEQQAEFQQTAVLDEAQAQQVQDILNRLSGAVAPTESVREQLNQSFEIIDQQQQLVDSNQQQLEQHRSEAQQLQEAVDRQTEELRGRWQEWRQAQVGLEQSQAELQAKQALLQTRQEQLDLFSAQLQEIENLYQQVYGLATGMGAGCARVDQAALENMPLGELERTATDLEKDLEKVSRFVDSQEEELALLKTTIDDLQNQIQAASEYDRLGLENELADSRESYEMLNETLVGQRRNLQERKEILKLHKSILARRQGKPLDNDQEADIDLGPVLEQLSHRKDQQNQRLEELRQQIRELEGEIGPLQEQVNHQQVTQQTQFDELRQMEQQCRSQQADVSELWGKINSFQESLEPARISMDSLRSKLDDIGNVMAKFQETSDYQLQAIAELRQVMSNLTGNQSTEFVVS
jgi:chromosome segregation ATPase